jgi:hypothetical protein
MSLKNPVKPPGIDPGTFRLVAQRLNHYATPGPPVPICRYNMYLSLHVAGLEHISNYLSQKVRS